MPKMFSALVNITHMLLVVVVVVVIVPLIVAPSTCVCGVRVCACVSECQPGSLEHSLSVRGG